MAQRDMISKVRKEKHDFKFSIELDRSEVVESGREHF